jgi:hypothetical protein
MSAAKSKSQGTSKGPVAIEKKFTVKQGKDKNKRHDHNSAVRKQKQKMRKRG